jgi:hypothetical protein
MKSIQDVISEILAEKLGKYRNNCPSDITDKVFLEIENEEDYYNVYQAAVAFKKNQQAVNQYIGKYIREYWNLENTGRCSSPKSKLIKSYEKHRN